MSDEKVVGARIAQMKTDVLTFDVRVGYSGMLEETPSGKFCWNYKDKPGLSAVYQHIIATDSNGNFVGILQWYSLDLFEVQEAGTYVVPCCRRKGVGAALWRIMLLEVAPKRVAASAISSAGLALGKHVEREAPGRLELYDDQNLSVVIKAEARIMAELAWLYCR